MSRAAVEEKTEVARTLKAGDTFKIGGVEIELLSVWGNRARLRVQASVSETVALFPPEEQSAKI